MGFIKIFSQNYINQKLFEKDSDSSCFFQIPSIDCINYHQKDKKSYIFNEQEKNYFLKTNRPFDEKLYEKTFYQLFQLGNYSKTNQKEIIQKIYQDILFVFQKINPLLQMGADIEIDVIGGCIRDFILQNENKIKDIDILISWKNIKNMKPKDLLNIFPQHEKKILELITKGKWLNLIVQMIDLCFENEKKQVFDITTIQESDPDDNYNISEKILPGVIKMQKNYSIDLLISPENKNEYFNSFDFDICKVSWNIYKNKKFVKNEKEMFANFEAEIDFFADIYYQKNTLTITSFEKKDFETSIKNHYERILMKYPHYQLNIVSGVPEIRLLFENKEKYKIVQEIFGKIDFQNELNLQLETKEQESFCRKRVFGFDC
jgi:tRNA nucleotidyltransferase/poly(A) polymerase